MDPIHGVLLGVQLGTSLNPDQWVYQGEREIHESTSTSQWHGIAISGADPLFSTNLDRPIIYRIFEPSNLSRGMDGMSLSIASILIHN